MSTWTRHNNAQKMISKHFSYNEMCCKCGLCQIQVSDDQFLALLEELREEYGAPITVNSAYRCANKQAQLRKAGYETAVGISSHEQGKAADITAEDMIKLKAAAFKIFARYSIGLASSFIHLDSRSGGPRRWSYKT